MEEEERKLKIFFGDYDEQSKNSQEQNKQSKEDLEEIIRKSKELLQKYNIKEEEFILMD